MPSHIQGSLPFPHFPQGTDFSLMTVGIVLIKKGHNPSYPNLKGCCEEGKEWERLWKCLKLYYWAGHINDSLISPSVTLTAVVSILYRLAP